MVYTLYYEPALLLVPLILETRLEQMVIIQKL